MNITIIGAGAWGTALALHFAQNHQVSLWTHNHEHAQILQKERSNELYLSGFPFPSTLNICLDFVSAMENADLILIATPVVGLRPSLQKLRSSNCHKKPTLWACKGFEAQTGLLLHEVFKQELSENPFYGALSGPSFAQELAQGLPCAVSLASPNYQWVETLAKNLNNSTLRLYANADLVGVEVGGAVKNVMAIATGVADGLSFGSNARAALMTRGLAEMNRLAIVLGAKPSTLMGLAGMGDLILTGIGALSRNRNVGLKLAEGKNLTEILQELGHVAEGVFTAYETQCLARKYQIEMPITEAVCTLLDGKTNPYEVVAALMMRVPKSEQV